jgi:hypothetical protein
VKYLALALLALGLVAHAQVAVTTTIPAPFAAGTPAVEQAWTQPSAGATAVSANGVQTSGPVTTEFWYCNGGLTSAQCAASMLPPATSDTPPQGSAWVLAGSIQQTTPGITVAVTNLQFSNGYVFAARSEFTAGGGFGPFPSTFLAESIPSAPAAQPPAATPGVATVIN